MSFPKRGDIYWVQLDPTVGAEIKKTRPAVVVSNDLGNEYSDIIIVAPITSSSKKTYSFTVPIVLERVIFLRYCPFAAGGLNFKILLIIVNMFSTSFSLSKETFPIIA